MTVPVPPDADVVTSTVAALETALSTVLSSTPFDVVAAVVVLSWLAGSVRTRRRRSVAHARMLYQLKNPPPPPRVTDPEEWRETAYRVIAEASKAGRRVGAMVVTVPKQTYLEDGPDALLRAVAERIRATLDDDATVARLDGWRIAVLVTDVGDRQLRVLAETVRDTVVSEPVTVPGEFFGVNATASVDVLAGFDRRTVDTLAPDPDPEAASRHILDRVRSDDSPDRTGPSAAPVPAVSQRTPARERYERQNLRSTARKYAEGTGERSGTSFERDAAAARESLAAVVAEWAAYETSPLDVLARPALADVLVAETAAFHDALEDARRAELLWAGEPVRERAETLVAAVREARRAWRTADAHARRVGTALMSEAERNRVRRARLILERVESGHADAVDAATCLRLLDGLLDGIVVLPPRARLALEAKVPAPELTAGVEPTTAPVGTRP